MSNTQLISNILRYIREAKWPGVYGKFGGTETYNVITFRFKKNQKAIPFITMYGGQTILYVNQGKDQMEMIGCNTWKVLLPEYWKIFIRNHLDSDLQYYMFTQSQNASLHCPYNATVSAD